MKEFSQNRSVEASSSVDASISTDRCVLLMAGGSGLRAGGDIPKQMQTVAGLPMLMWSIKAFRSVCEDTFIVLVMNPECRDLWNSRLADFGDEYKVDGICDGGKDRLESVRNGLKYLEDTGRLTAESLIAVHDAARPMITPDVIRRGWECAKVKGSGVPVIPEVNSLRYAEGGKSRALDRSKYLVVQTPQIFRSDIILKAYNKGMSPEFTDDASVVEGDGEEVSLYEGDPSNLKVTTPVDFLLAEAILKDRE